MGQWGTVRAFVGAPPKEPEKQPAPVKQSAQAPSREYPVFGPDAKQDPQFEQSFRTWFDSTYKRNSSGRHPSYQMPTNEEYWAARSQFAYNANHSTQYGYRDLNFGTPIYLPYEHSDDDNNAWAYYVKTYGDYPQNDEMMNYARMEYGAKRTKDAYGILGISYKEGDTFKDNGQWKILGFDYNPNDYTDMQRAMNALPPRAWTDKFNMDDPEDVQRLKAGEVPKYYVNTDAALREMKLFEGAVMELAAQNKITSVDQIRKLYADGVAAGQYKYLSSIDDYLAAYDTAVGKGEGYSSYDQLTGKAAKLPWQHLDLDVLQQQGYGIKDEGGIKSSTWLDDLANKAIKDQQTKYGARSSSNWWLKTAAFLGGYPRTEYEKKLKETAKAPSWEQPPNNPDSETWVSRTPNGEQVATYTADDGLVHAVKIESDGTMLDFGTYDTANEAKDVVERNWGAIVDPSFGKVTGAALAEGLESSGSALLSAAAQYAKTPGAKQNQELYLPPAASHLKNVDVSTMLSDEAQELSNRAAANAAQRQTDNWFLQQWGDTLSAVPSVAVGAGLSAVDPVLGVGFWATLGYGEGVQTAKEAGATEGQQQLYGAVDSLANIALGMFQGKLFAGALKKSAIDTAKRSLTKAGLKALLNTAEMSGGMTAQQIALNAARKGIFDSSMSWLPEKDKNAVFDPAQMKQAAEGGAIMSILLQVLGIGVGKASRYVKDTLNSGKRVNVDMTVALLREDAGTIAEAKVLVDKIDEIAKPVQEEMQDAGLPTIGQENYNTGGQEENVPAMLRRTEEVLAQERPAVTQPTVARPAEEQPAPVEEGLIVRPEQITGTDVFKPVREVKYEDKDIVSIEKEGDITEFQRNLLEDMADPIRRKQIEAAMEAFRDDLNADVQDTLEQMKARGKKGVTIDTEHRTRISNNEQWYRDLYHERNKTPTQERMRQAAFEFTMDPNSDFYSPDFADKLKTYEEVRNLMEKVKGKGDILSVETTPEGDIKVTYGKADRSASLKPPKATTDYTPDIQTRAAAAGYGTDPKNLVDAFLDLKNGAVKVGTPKAKSIAKEAQGELTKIMNGLRERADTLPFEPNAANRLDMMIDASEKKLKTLIQALQDEVQAVKDKAKADLKKLREQKNAKLDEAERKRQADVAKMMLQKIELREKKLAELEQKRQADLSHLREQKNISFEWKRTASAIKDLHRQFDGKERPLPDGYSDFIGEALQGLERTKGKNKAPDAVATVDRFETWLNGLDEAAMDEAGISAEDRARVLGWISEVKGKNIHDMDLEQHKALGKLVRRMEHLSRSYYRFFGKRKHLEMQPVRDAVITQLDKTLKSKSYEQQTEANKLYRFTSRAADRYWGYQSLKPYVAVEYLLHDTADTPARRILSDDLRQADHDAADMNMKDLEVKREIFSGVKSTAWGGKTAPKTEYVLEKGGKTALTKAEELFVWLNSKNEFNREAMLNGIRFEKTGTEFTPTEADVKAIVARVEATPEMLAIGKKWMERFNTEFKLRANSTSRQLYGYDIAAIENYVPVERVGDARATHFQTVGKTLESFSWTKGRSGGRAAVVGWDLFEMYDRMALETAQYAAYAVPVKNAQRLIGAGAVRTKVIEKRGPLAFDYYKRLLGDVAERGQQQQDTTGGLFDAVRRNSQAAIMASPWVMANQYAQVPALFSYVEPKYAIAGLKIKMPKGDIAMMRKYAPELFARRMFGGMTEDAELRKAVGDNPGIIARIRELSTKGVGLNDTLTINYAWEMAKAQISGKFKDLTGDTYWQKVGELASNAIEETQPSHGLFTRSLFENTKTPLERLLFMFSGGPNAIWNMGAHAIAEMRWGGAAGKAKAGKLIGGIVASQLAFAGIAAIRKVLTDNDGNLAGEFGKQVMLSFLTVPYLFNIPVSWMEGFDTRLQGMDQLQKITDAGISLVDLMKPVEYAVGDTAADKARKKATHDAKVVGKWWSILEQISSMSGLPVHQLDRDIIRPTLKRLSEKAYNDYVQFFGSNTTYAADFKAASKNPEKARSILRDWVADKGSESVRQSLHQSDWYKALAPQEKAYWDRALANMR